MTTTQSFLKWFSDSKVVDKETGLPVVAYHGTKADFSQFKATRSGEFGPAIYLTSNPREASEYASGKALGEIEGTHVMPVFVAIKNPFEAGVDAFWAQFASDDGDAQAIERAKAAGYDGVIMTRPDLYYDEDARLFVERGQQLTHYVAFNPNQIKSAVGNNGDFDAQNPDIRFSIAEPASWLDTTLAMTETGSPMMVFRGQHSDTLLGDIHILSESLSESITFNADAAVANMYALQPTALNVLANHPYIVPAYLDIRNPILFHPGDPYVQMAELVEKLGARVAETLARKLGDHIQETSLWQDQHSRLFSSVDDFLNKCPNRLGELYFQAWPLLGDSAFLEAAKAAGFDGCIAPGTGAFAHTLNYTVFSSEQVKPAYAWAGQVQDHVQKMADLLAESADIAQETPHG